MPYGMPPSPEGKAKLPAKLQFEVDGSHDPGQQTELPYGMSTYRVVPSTSADKLTRTESKVKDELNDLIRPNMEQKMDTVIMDSFGGIKSQTLQEESKHLHDSAIINPVIKTAKYRNLFNNLNEPIQLQRIAYESARTILNHRKGTKFEDLTFIDSATGKHITRDDYDMENQVMPSKRMRSMVQNNAPYTIIAVQNHPGSSVPSIADLESAYRHKYKYGVILCHNGTIMKYEVLGQYNEVIVSMLLDKANIDLYHGNEKELSKTIEQLRAENILLEVFK